MLTTCPNCRSPVEVHPQLAGMPCTCPICRGPFVAPVPDEPFIRPRRTFAPLKKRSDLPTVAVVLLSFVLPGLGQLAQGRAGAGVGFLVSYVICLGLWLTWLVNGTDPLWAGGI